MSNLPVINETKRDDSKKMKAVMFQGKQKVHVGEIGRPLITDPGDVILRVTDSCICGSDLHLYLNAMPGMQKGDVLGHEIMGVVEEVGQEVKGLKKGDRVVSSFHLSCGKCKYCQMKQFSCCEVSNIAPEGQDSLMGHHTAGMHGYSHLTGGFAGGQAEYTRVPLADVNCLKIPDSLTNDQAVFLSDILPTAWHACELGAVSQGDQVAIWGAGPVGLLAAHCALVRGARQVVVVDNQPDRLHLAETKLGVKTINYDKEDPCEQLWKILGKHGVDVAIEAVGMHYAKTKTHKAELATGMETDSADTINEIMKAVRKAGRVSIVGAYGGMCNHFNIGALMEKQLTVRAGQTPCQRYWPVLLPLLEQKKLDPTFIITHRLPLDEAPQGYKEFNEKADQCIKVILNPSRREREVVATA